MSVAEEQAIVVVQDAGGVGLRREVRTHIFRQLFHIQFHVVVLEAEACQPRAGAALLVLGEAIGGCLGVALIVEEIVGRQAHRLTADARLPDLVRDVIQTLDSIGRIDIVVVLPIVGVGGKAGTSE